jgi:hypothetical protein
MNKLFFSQRILDSLIDEGKIKLEKNILTLLSGDRPSFELEPAYRIVRTADGSRDPNRLVGLIRSEREIKTLGAEAYLNSVIYRNVAYEAEPGFIGEKQELMDRLSDTDLLTRFLLENLL